MKVFEGRIQVVFFDAGGTLFEVRRSVGAVYTATARSFGASVDARILDERFFHAFKENPPMCFPGLQGEDLERAEREWWFAVIQKVMEGFLSGPDLAEFFGDVYDVFRRKEAWRLFRDVKKTLGRLRGHGYRLAVISNFDSRLVDILDVLDVARDFEQVIVSSRSPAAKPGPEIFRKAVTLMNVDAGACLHIGDSPVEDVAGARRAGLRAALIDRKGEYVDSNEDWRVKSLLEVCAALGA